MLVDLFWKDFELTSHCAYILQYSLLCCINFLNLDASLQPFALHDADCFTLELSVILLELILECLNFIVSLSE
jgi:hypothetical protein